MSRRRGLAMPTKQIILLVEDNRDDELLTTRILRRINLADNIVVARSGQEALEFLSTRDSINLPIMVLLDLKMPKINGLEVLQRIRIDPNTSQLPVIILTASNEESDRQESYRLGADNYLVKPLEIKQFAEAVKQIGLSYLLNKATHQQGG